LEKGAVAVVSFMVCQKYKYVWERGVMQGLAEKWGGPGTEREQFIQGLLCTCLYFLALFSYTAGLQAGSIAVKQIKSF